MKMRSSRAEQHNSKANRLEYSKAGVDVEKHDVVIASRPAGLRDIIKLNSAANKYVFILSLLNAPVLRKSDGFI